MNYTKYVIARLDQHMMETTDPVMVRDDYMRMVVRHLNSKMENTWRVKINGDDTIRLTDFSLQHNQKNLPDDVCLNKVNTPDWVKSRLAILQICEVGTIVDSVGQRVSENVYYVIE